VEVFFEEESMKKMRFIGLYYIYYWYKLRYEQKTVRANGRPEAIRIAK